MVDRPILFSAPMVRALLDGSKTQTRRIIQSPSGIPTDACTAQRMVRYAAGDRLWVREALDMCRGGATHLPIWSAGYRADAADFDLTRPGALDFAQRCGDKHRRFVNSIHMPRWASRLTLIVEAVRVERLQNISAADSLAEGVACETCVAMSWSACGGKGCFASLSAFRGLWESINSPGSWLANPWVAAITFRVVASNIDEVAP